MVRCPACGHELADTANFCAHCGSSLAKVAGDTTRVIPLITDDTATDELLEQSQVAADALPDGSSLLVVVRGNQVGARYLINSDETTVGRHPRSDIFLDDVTVSRHHARFTRRDGCLRVRDENSLNGTYVNQTLIDDEVPLRRGDTVQIGKFRMVYFDGRPGPS